MAGAIPISIRPAEGEMLRGLCRQLSLSRPLSSVSEAGDEAQRPENIDPVDRLLDNAASLRGETTEHQGEH